jgi:hypothetical protein
VLVAIEDDAEVDERRDRERGGLEEEHCPGGAGGTCARPPGGVCLVWNADRHGGLLLR